jgi:hypothetical protein
VGTPVVGRTVGALVGSVAGGAVVGPTARALPDFLASVVDPLVRVVGFGSIVPDPVATLARSADGFADPVRTTGRTFLASRPGARRSRPGTLTWLRSVRARAAASSTTRARKIRLPHRIADTRAPDVSLNTGLPTKTYLDLVLRGTKRPPKAPNMLRHCGRVGIASANW